MGVLHTASYAGDLSKIRLGLEAVDVDSKDVHGVTALMYASGGGQQPAIRLLLEAGAAVDSEGNTGETALMRAGKKWARRGDAAASLTVPSCPL